MTQITPYQNIFASPSLNPHDLQGLFVIVLRWSDMSAKTVQSLKILQKKTELNLLVVMSSRGRPHNVGSFMLFPLFYVYFTHNTRFFCC